MRRLALLSLALLLAACSGNRRSPPRVPVTSYAPASGLYGGWAGEVVAEDETHYLASALIDPLDEFAAFTALVVYAPPAEFTTRPGVIDRGLGAYEAQGVLEYVSGAYQFTSTTGAVRTRWHWFTGALLCDRQWVDDNRDIGAVEVHLNKL